MRARFVFDPDAWRIPEARHAIEVVASLLEVPWRCGVQGVRVDAGDPTVFVGRPARAPEDSAAVVPVEGWPRWEPSSLEVVTFEGEPLPCPGGDLGGAGDSRRFPGVWLRAIGFLIQRDEEFLDPRRDAWECFSGFTARLETLGILDRPLVNLYAAQLERRLAAWCARRQVTPPAVPRWKDGARFAVVLTHDVDDVQLYSLRGAWRLIRLARSPSSYAFRGGVSMALRTLRRGPRRGDPYWNFDRWAAEESRHGLRSTFFFCPPAPTRRHENDAFYRMTDPVEFEGARMPLAGMLRLLAGRGFEIGLHGSYLSHVSAEELARQKGQIEASAGCEIRGVRQHFLRFDAGRTWAAQEAAAFQYDSTLGYNEAVGFRAGIAAPFHPWDPEARGPRRLIELPLTVMDGALFRTLKLDAASVARRVREHLERVESAGGLAVLLWHPNAAAENLFPGWWRSYTETLEYLASRRAWIATAGEIAEWWRAREKRMGGPG